MARRRKEGRRVGIASRGIVRPLGRFSSRVRHRVVPDRDKVPDRCNSSGAAVDVRSDALAWAPRAERAADGGVVYVSRAFSCRQVHRELMRSAVLDLTPIIPATACHQRNYVERYSRFRAEAEDTGYTLMELALIAGHMVLFYSILLLMYMLLTLANAETRHLCLIHNP